MIGGGAPKGVELAFVFHEGKDQVVMALFIETTNWFGIKAGSTPAGKISQSIQERFNILNITQQALILMHAFKLLFRKIGN